MLSATTKKETDKYDEEILNLFEEAVSKKDIEIAKEIVDKLVKSEVSSALQYRIGNICILIKQQQRTGEKNIINFANGAKEMLELYTNVMFSLRRIEVLQDANLVEEALNFLKAIEIGPFALGQIIEKEELEDNEQFYWRIYEKMDNWSDDECIIWLEHMNYIHKSKRGSIRLISLYMKVKNYQKALAFINFLKTNDEELLRIKEKLERVLVNQ